MDIDGRMCLVALPSRPTKEKYAWKPWKTMENHQENISIPTLDSRSGIQLRRNSLITPYLPHRTAPKKSYQIIFHHRMAADPTHNKHTFEEHTFIASQ